MRTLLLLFLMLPAAASQAETYRWTDQSGKTVISDTPPPTNVRGLVQHGTAANTEATQPFALQKASEDFPVILYSTPNCQTPCKQGRELLSKRGIPFTDKEIRTQEEADALKALTGEFVVPFLTVGKQTFKGYEAGAWNNLLDLAGYPKSAARNGQGQGTNSK